MATVLVTALYDEDLNFFPPNGELKEIDVTSIYLGTKNLPTLQIEGDNTNEIPTFDCLVMKDPTLGTLYLNMTLEQWNAAVTNATSSGNATSIMGFPIFANPDHGLNSGDVITFDDPSQTWTYAFPTIGGVEVVTAPTSSFPYLYYNQDTNTFSATDGPGFFVLYANQTATGFDVNQVPYISSDGTTITNSDSLSFDGTTLTVKEQINLLDISENGVRLSLDSASSTSSVVFQNKDGYIALTNDISERYNAVGDTTIDRPEDTWLTAVAIYPADAPETIQIGTTPGGTEILAPTLFINGVFTPVSVLKYFDVTTTIYISGAVGNVIYKLHF